MWIILKIPANSTSISFAANLNLFKKKINTFIGQEKINENFGNFSCITPCYF